MLWGFLQILFVFSFGFCQDVPSLELDQIGEILQFIRNFDSKFQELNQKLTDNHQIHMAEITSSKEDFNDKLTNFEEKMQDQIEQLRKGRTAEYEYMFSTFVEILNMEHNFQRDSIERTCSRGELTQLQTSMQMEFNKMNESIENLPSTKHLRNLQTLITTEFNKMNESIEELPSNADLTNMQTQIIEATPCLSPAKHIQGLGCVTPVRTRLNWEAAKQNCIAIGGQLLEGITTQQQLNDLGTHFNGYLNSCDSWIGLYNFKWIGSGNTVSKSSPLWYSGEPSGDGVCVEILFPVNGPSLFDYGCSNTECSLCQN